MKTWGKVDNVTNHIAKSLKAKFGVGAPTNNVGHGGAEEEEFVGGRIVDHNVDGESYCVVAHTFFASLQR